MMKRTKWSPLPLLLSLCSLQSRAAVRLAQPGILANAFRIRNRSNRRIAFWLGKGDTQWASYRLEPGEARIYDDKDRIWMATPGQEPAHYRLAAGETYAIVGRADTDSWRTECVFR